MADQERPPLADRPEAPSSAHLPPDVVAALADPKSRVGPYVLVCRLGAGGMGEVWKAWELDLGRWVALKFLRGSDPEELARFEREARTAAGLTHPNIAAVHGFSREAARPYIAMQYVDGVTLKACPSRSRRERVALMRVAARAVAYAHEHGIVHRDVKPENIMTDRRGHVFVMDFGLARPLLSGNSLTVTGGILGTPSYMSPEQARGSPADARSDVYSLGATLYELLAGRAPFVDGDLVTLLRRVTEEAPRPLRAAVPGLERELETIVMKCLEKEPARRYASALELAEDLRRWLEGEPILAAPPSRASDIRRWLVRRKGAVSLAAAVLIAAGVVGLTLRWQQQRQLAALREQSERELATLRELSEAWLKLVVEAQKLRMPQYKPSQVRRALEDASAPLDELVRKLPNRAESHYVRARSHLYLNELVRAQEHVDAALRLAPDSALVHALAGQVAIARSSPYANIKDPRSDDSLLKLAREHFTRALAPGDRMSWGLPATEEEETARHIADAMITNDWARLEEELKEHPRGEYAYMLGFALQRREYVEQALQLMPHFARAHVLRSWDRHNAGDIEGSIEDATAAIELAPGFPEGWYHRANGRWAQGRYDEALEDYTKAVELLPDFAYAWLGRGMTWAAKGDIDLAIADYDRAIEHNPLYDRAWFNRGLAWETKGDLDRAIADLEQVLVVNAEWAWRPALERKIQELKNRR